MIVKTLAKMQYRVCTLTVKSIAFEEPVKSEIMDEWWYCGYITIPRSHKLFRLVNVHTKSIFLLQSKRKRYWWNYDKLNIECHGGLTYYRKETEGHKIRRITVGWDYQHLCDKTAMFSVPIVLQECKDVVDQLFRRIK